MRVHTYDGVAFTQSFMVDGKIRKKNNDIVATAKNNDDRTNKSQMTQISGKLSTGYNICHCIYQGIKNSIGAVFVLRHEPPHETLAK